MSINILKDFISENAGPISIKFHAQLQGRDGGLNGVAHMTKMAATSKSVHIWY